MTLTRTMRGALAVGLILAGGAAIAATAKQTVDARQAHYKEMGKASKAIGDQLKSGAPDLAIIKANAATVTRIGQLQSREIWFPPGTQSGQGLDTAASSAIWKNLKDFNAKRADLAKATAGYAAIANGGNVAAIKAAATTVGKACKGCHDAYRDEDKS